MSDARHAIVVGGGIGGLTAALCLAHDGCRVTVLEQAPEPGEVGAGIQLSPNCTRVLHHLGLQAELARVAFVPEATQFRHWRSGDVIARTELGAAVLERYGAPYYHVHRADLLGVLAGAVAATPGIALHTGQAAVSVRQDATSASVQTSTADYRGDLVIGADGIHSTVRAALWGADQPRFTGHVAWRALVPTARLPAGLIRPMSTVWWGPRRHFVHYYVRRGELVNCVGVVEKSGWEVESWTARGDRAELEADFSGWHPDIQQLIRHIDREALFKWAIFDRDPMPRWGKARITLLGDACHPALPTMAQGAAMAIEDAAVLAALLAGGSAVPAALDAYENLRRSRTAWVQLGARRNARVFHYGGPMAWLRNRAAKVLGGRQMQTLYGYDALRVARGREPSGAA